MSPRILDFLRVPLRWWHALLVLLAVTLGAVLLLSYEDTGTRLVRYDGQLCTEHFRLKDGTARRVECPSRGGEWYADTAEVRSDSRVPRGGAGR